MNKTDPYVEFDPTQIEGEGCCGPAVWDMATGQWKVVERADPADPCADIRAQLAQARENLAKANETIAETEERLTDAMKTVNELTAAVEEKDAKIKELEEQLANAPTVCDVLKANVDPIYDTAGNFVAFGVKEDACPELTEALDDTANNNVSRTVSGN